MSKTWSDDKQSKLEAWLRENDEELFSRGMHLPLARTRASEALGFPIGRKRFSELVLRMWFDKDIYYKGGEQQLPYRQAYSGPEWERLRCALLARPELRGDPTLVARQLRHDGIRGYSPHAVRESLRFVEYHESVGKQAMASETATPHASVLKGQADG